jgi:hypothetical protein
MRPGGKEGYIYEAELGAEISTAGVLADECFYKITAKASSGSGLPAALPVGYCFYNKPAKTLVEGDKVKKVTLTKLTFARDDEDSSSREKFDNTVQIDAVKSFDIGKSTEKSGSISGYYDTASEAQKRIENHFNEIIEDDGAGNVVLSGIDSDIFLIMLSRRETTEVGEMEIWEYKPSIVDSLSKKKPMDGSQEFSFNYTVVGNQYPFVYRRKVTA